MSPTNPIHSRLSAVQVEQYAREGYTLFQQPVFSNEKFALLKAISEENLERYGEDDLDTMHFRDARLLPFLMAEEVLDLVEPLVGPNIGLWSSAFISKSPFKGKATPWHEDSAYWDGRISTMEGIVTIWLALDRATKENGCMAVVPGTHSNGFSQYEDVDDTSQNIFYSQIQEGAVENERAVYFELEPNQCSLHEARIIHGGTGEYRAASPRRLHHALLPAFHAHPPRKEPRPQNLARAGKTKRTTSSRTEKR